MTIHPLFKTLATRPELLAEHAGAYLQLASAEAVQAGSLLRTRLVLLASALICAGLGVMLAGVALLLLAVVPLDQMPAPWALALAPAVPLAAAGGLWWAQRRRELDLSFALLRQQVALDRSLLQQLAQR